MDSQHALNAKTGKWGDASPVKEIIAQISGLVKTLDYSSLTVECHKETVKTVVSCLEQMGIPFTTGKTWTSDAIYRETPDMVELRRNEGCITVEMEAAAFFAVSQYYNIPLAQLLYAGDDVSGDEWDSRNWNMQKNIRYNLISSAIEVVKRL